MIRTPVRLEWSHDQHGTRPRHRSGHRCRGARVRPGPPCRRRRRRGRPAPRGVRLGGPAPGGVDRRRGPRSATPRSRSPDPAPRWSRSSVWPSSRPRSGCPPRPARPTSVRPSSCGTGSRAPGPGSGAGDLPAWRARRIARATIAPEPGGGGVRGRPGRRVRAPDPPQRRGPAGRGGDRPVHAGRGPAPPGGRRRRPARARAHPPGVLRGHRVGGGRGRPRRRPGPGHRPLGRCRPAGRPRLHRVAGRAPLRSPRGDGPAPARPGPRHRHRRPPLRHRLRAAGGAARAPLRPTRSRHPGRSAAPGPGGEHPLVRRRRPGPRLVRRPRHHGDREAGGRPGRAPPRRPVPGPRPARRTKPPNAT